jgi:hypothetical protein
MICVLPNMCNFSIAWVRQLIGKLRVPYNRGLGVRGSSHPLLTHADDSGFTAESKVWRIHSDLPSPYYNFCKIHRALRMTPAMAAGVEQSIWTVEDLVKACGE